MSEYERNRKLNFDGEGYCYAHLAKDCADCDSASHLGVVPAGQEIRRDAYPKLFDAIERQQPKYGDLANKLVNGVLTYFMYDGEKWVVCEGQNGTPDLRETP